VRAEFQFIDIELDLTLDAVSVESENRNLFTRRSFPYELSPQTALFVGYGDRPIADDETQSPTRADQTFFLKLGYAWLQGGGGGMRPGCQLPADM
jgi:hypothetical protein